MVHVYSFLICYKLTTFGKGDPCLPFQSLQHRGVGDVATLFPGFLHSTLDTYLIMLSVKQVGIRYHFWDFGMTQPEIETRSPEPLANTLLIKPIAWL